MKKVVIILFVLSVMQFALTGEDNLFSKTSVVYAKSIVFKYSNPEYIKNIPASLKRMTLKYGEYTEVFNFSDGKLASEDSNVRDGRHNEYIYDDKGRLINCTPDFSFEYEDDFKRKIFFMNNLQRIEKVVYEDSCIKATCIDIGKNRKTGELFESTIETVDYFYENNLERLVKIIDKTFMNRKDRNQMSMGYEYDFEYNSCENGDELKKITCINLKDNSVFFTEEFSYSDGQLTQIITDYPNRSSWNARTVLSDYDEYGNFRCCKIFDSDGAETTYTREFVYEN